MIAPKATENSLEAEVLADLSENDLTDDNGCKTDHDGTAACVDIRKA